MRFCLYSPGMNWEARGFPGVEDEQILTIDEYGNVCLETYCYSLEHEKVVKRKESCLLDEKTTQDLMHYPEIVGQTEPSDYPDYIRPWILSWEDGQTNGLMNGKVYADDVDLNEYMRKVIPLSDLFVFDNTDRQDIGMGCYCAE